MHKYELTYAGKIRQKQKSCYLVSCPIDTASTEPLSMQNRAKIRLNLPNKYISILPVYGVVRGWIMPANGVLSFAAWKAAIWYCLRTT